MFLLNFFKNMFEKLTIFVENCTYMRRHTKCPTFGKSTKNPETHLYQRVL